MNVLQMLGPRLEAACNWRGGRTPLVLHRADANRTEMGMSDVRQARLLMSYDVVTSYRELQQRKVRLRAVAIPYLLLMSFPSHFRRPRPALVWSERRARRARDAVVYKLRKRLRMGIIY